MPTENSLFGWHIVLANGNTYRVAVVAKNVKEARKFLQERNRNRVYIFRERPNDKVKADV